MIVVVGGTATRMTTTVSAATFVPARGRWSNTVPAAGRASTRVWTVGGALKPASCSWPCATNADLAPFSNGVVTLWGSWV
jgi:hypothetical protein